jgi:hypothetical protein
MATQTKIKDMPFLEDLQPFLGLPVEPGVTVGDSTFVSAQDVFSTTFIAPTADNQLPTNIDANLFQSAIGDAGQGLGSGVVMTRGQTNWKYTSGRTAANEAFLGTYIGFKVFKVRITATNGQTCATVGCNPSGAGNVLFPDISALAQITNSLSWEYNVGNTIPRVVGPIGNFPQGCGAWAAASNTVTGTCSSGTIPLFTQDVTGSTAVQNGAPDKHMRQLAIPFLFPPNINVSVKIRSGSALDLATLATTVNSGTGKLTSGGTVSLQYTATTSAPYVEYLAIQATMRGYLLTTNV